METMSTSREMTDIDIDIADANADTDMTMLKRRARSVRHYIHSMSSGGFTSSAGSALISVIAGAYFLMTMS